MLKAWKTRFTATSKDEYMTDLPELLDYIVNQETVTLTKVAENAMKQHHKSPSNKKPKKNKNLPVAITMILLIWKKWHMIKSIWMFLNKMFFYKYSNI